MAQRNQQDQPSPHHSRVSSSNSSQHNQSYELIPRQQPFSNLHRDLPSPRASFPFKRVQAGVESSQNNRSNADSSVRGQSRQQRQSKELIEAIGQLRGSNIISGRAEQQQKLIIQPISHQQCNTKIQQLQLKIDLLKQKIDSQRQQFQLQRKANEVYMEGFSKIRQIVNTYSDKKLQSEGVEQLSQKLQQMMKKRQYTGHQYQIIQQKEIKISELRLQLLKSSQNNINAIFNTQITEAHCMHLQIKKMNSQIMGLKDNLMKVTAENQFNVNQLLQKDKIVKVYHHNRSNVIQTSDQEDVHTQLKLTRRRKSKRHNRRDSSSSDKYNRSKMLSNTQSKVGQLVEGYKVLRDQYKRLQNTLGQVFQNNSQYRVLFKGLREQINNTLQTQLREVKQTIRRPSSSHSQLRVAKDLQFKLNHLVNTLNAPQRVNIQQNMGEDEVSQWRSVEVHRKMVGFQSNSSHLYDQINHLSTQNQQLKKRLWMQEHHPSRSLPQPNPGHSLQTFSSHLLPE